MNYRNLLIEKKGATGTIIINRPQVLNALNMETVKELEEAVRELGGDKGLRVMVITGAGEKAFVSGADIAAMKEMSEGDALEFARQGHAAMNAIENFPRPVIAAVNGFALGGGTELALACDFIYASDRAKFGLPEVKLGLYPGFGGTQRLARLVGAARAKEMIFSGRVISAAEAQEIGIANRVIAAAELMQEVYKLAGDISANGPIAISLAKRLINEGGNLPFNAALENEQNTFAELFATAESREGLSAFLEKRRPNFK